MIAPCDVSVIISQNCSSIFGSKAVFTLIQTLVEDLLQIWIAYAIIFFSIRKFGYLHGPNQDLLSRPLITFVVKCLETSDVLRLHLCYFSWPHAYDLTSLSGAHKSKQFMRISKVHFCSSMEPSQREREKKNSEMVYYHYLSVNIMLPRHKTAERWARHMQQSSKCISKMCNLKWNTVMCPGLQSYVVFATRVQNTEAFSQSRELKIPAPGSDSNTGAFGNQAQVVILKSCHTVRLLPNGMKGFVCYF